MKKTLKYVTLTDTNSHSAVSYTALYNTSTVLTSLHLFENTHRCINYYARIITQESRKRENE